jgi:signal transduction histidine kinase
MSKSPTVRLLLGLLVTLAVVTVFSWYSLRQLAGLRQLQRQTIDLNRHDSLLLLQVQNDLNEVGLKLRDMVQAPGASSISRYEAEFERLRSDLEQSIKDEVALAPVTRRPASKEKLIQSLQMLRRVSDEVFQRAKEGHAASARELAATRLSAEQEKLDSLVLHLLERNNEAEEQADQKISSIYRRVEKDIYVFIVAMLIAIAVTSSYLIYSNRQIFNRLESLSHQRRVLAGRLLTIQEEVLRSVSRELHDEFGQILTAVATMLARAERKGVPPDSPLRTELSEVRQITHNTLERMRSLSQMLHPAILDDYGLAKGIEWYAEVFQRQTGITTKAIVEGVPVRITGQPATNCFRIMQEALNNAAKHSGTKRAEIHAVFRPNSLTLGVRDFGHGLPPVKKGDKPGLGLIAMRERAELLNGKLQVVSAPNAGTTVTITMPLTPEDDVSEAAEQHSMGEVISGSYE